MTLVPLGLAGVLYLAFELQSRLKPHNRGLYEQRYGFIFLLVSYILLPTMSVVLFGVFECDEFEDGSDLFICPLLLNSLVTGPNILVPTGSPLSSTKTAALLSNLTFEPSFL